MIMGIKIKNAYSIKETEISFIKGKFTYKKEMVEGNYVNPVSIYGVNGSGKSSVVNVINDVLSLLIGDKESFYPIIANFNYKNEPSFIEFAFKIDDVEYVYGLSTSFQRSLILNEYLLENKKAIFTRNEERVVVEDKEYRVTDGLLLSLRELYSRLDELDGKESIRKAYIYLTNINVIKEDNTVNSKLCNYKSINELIKENSEEVKRVISNYEDFLLYDLSDQDGVEYLNLYFENKKELKIPAFLISEGMATLLKILSLMINIDEGGLLIIDCVEKNLHLSSINLIIKEAKKRGIQLLFTSHNTSLMQELRPDQIYFARLRKGISYYFKLSNIYDNIRKINNIEKMYLSNTFNEAINEIINVSEE